MDRDPARRDELEMLLREHRGALLRSAIRLTRSAVEAEDLLQEACVRALRSFHRFEPGSRFRPWLLRILRNVVIDDYHRRRRSPATVDYDRVIEAMDGNGRETSIAPLVGSRRTRHEETMSLRLEEALAELPQEARTAVILAYVEGLRYEEIAKILDRPTGTVMSRLHRSRRRLRRRIEGFARPSTGAGLRPGG